MAYYFNLPIITELTIDQQAAVDEIDPLALSGGPGTGKSVVCLWRHIRNYATGMKYSLLLTYTKTLEYYLKESAASQNSEAGNNIDRTFYWLYNNRKEYEEIIIDEGQDVGIDKYHQIKNYSSEISYGADDAQSLYQDGCTPEELLNLFPDNEEYTLDKNFRNSKEILLFTRSVFPNIVIQQNTINEAKETGLKPILKIIGWNNEKEEVEQIMSIINDFAGDTHNIGILVPLRSHVNKYYELIKNELDKGKECSKYENEMNDFNTLSGIHITTFKSSKGTEFDTVIIPNFDSFDWMINNMNIITEKDYYVAFTRTKTNLFLICKYNPNKGGVGTYEIE